MIKILTFQNPYSAEDARNILVNCDSTVNVVKMEAVYYPYKEITYSLTLPGKLSKLDKEVTCIVDLIYGRPAVAQGTPLFTESVISNECAMERVISEKEVYDVSYDFVFKLFLNKSKILSAPKISVLTERLFHKMFYVVQCRDAEEKDYFVLVDSIDGSITILDWKPETEEIVAPNPTAAGVPHAGASAAKEESHEQK